MIFSLEKPENASVEILKKLGDKSKPSERHPTKSIFNNPPSFVLDTVHFLSTDDSPLFNLDEMIREPGNEDEREEQVDPIAEQKYKSQMDRFSQLLRNEEYSVRSLLRFFPLLFL